MIKEKFEKNPFYPDLSKVSRLEVTRIPDEPELSEMVDTATGEIHDSYLKEVQHATIMLTHKTKFIKLMSDNIYKLAKLSAAGTKVFWLLSGSVSLESKDKDYVYLGYEHCKGMAKSIGVPLPQSTYYKGIDDLVDNVIIARSTRTNIFWLNISILFNGNFSKLPEIRKLDTVRRKLEAEGKKITNVYT